MRENAYSKSEKLYLNCAQVKIIISDMFKSELRRLLFENELLNTNHFRNLFLNRLKKYRF